MEDLATARISVAQTTQRIIHSAKDADSGDVHSLALAKRIFLSDEEIVKLCGEGASADGGSRDETVRRYCGATKVSMQWVENYTEFDFRSLGSYTRDDLAAIAAADGAF